MNLKSILLLPIATICIAGCSAGGGSNTAASGGGSSTSKGSDMVTFAYKPKVGDTATYAMKVVADLNGTPQNLEASVKISVKDAGSGNVDVESVTDGLPGGSHTSVETIDSSGKILKTTMDGKPATSGSDAGSSVRDMMPDHPVKVGDTWTGKRNMNGKPITAEYKLDKVEDQGGKQVATITLTKLDLPQGKLAEPGKIVVEPATGTLHSMSVSISMTVQNQVMKETVTMEKK